MFSSSLRNFRRVEKYDPMENDSNVTAGLTRMSNRYTRFMNDISVNQSTMYLSP